MKGSLADGDIGWQNQKRICFGVHRSKFYKRRSIMNKRILTALYIWGIAALLMIVFNCTKHHPHPIAPEPDPVIPDTVVVIDTVTVFVVGDSVFIHEHHDHGVACNTVDLIVEFIVTGDESAVYVYFLNGEEVGRFAVVDMEDDVAEVTFQAIFQNVTLGDIITIRKVDGDDEAAVIGASLIGILCSGQVNEISLSTVIVSDTVTVSVNINTEVLVDAWGFDFKFDEAFILFVRTESAGTLTEDWPVSRGQRNSAGMLRVGGLNNTQTITGSGVLIKLVFAGSEVGEVEILNLVDDLSGFAIK